MKILFVNSARGPGGGITSALDLAHGLAGRGHEVAVVCHPEGGIRHRLDANSAVRAVPIAIRAELNPWRAVQLARRLAELRPDVVLADKRKDVKLSHAARRLRSDVALVHRHGAPSVLRDSVVYRAVWTRLDGLIVNSEAMRTQLLAATPWLSVVPMHVIPNGKDLGRYRPRPEMRDEVRLALGIPEHAFVVCYHGVLQPRKQVDVLLRALGPRPAGLGLHALIIGAGESREMLEDRARRSGVPVTFTGARDDVPELLAAADVAVHLSTAEGFSNAVVEAMACGLPVVASRATSHGEQITEGVHGRLVPPGDETAVLAAITELATEPVLRQTMAAAARARAELEFGLDRMIAAYERALTNAVTHHAGARAGGAD
jgi:glycosyltransferase involved in cell wall biosynthesis